MAARFVCSIVWSSCFSRRQAAWGEYDTVAPYSMAVELAEGALNGKTSRIPGAAHLPPAEQPAATALLIRDFFHTVQR